MIKSNCIYRFNATPEGLCVSVAGEIDHHSASTMRRDVDNIIWNRTPTHLILDMSEVSFMDSSGIAFILRAQQRMQMMDGSLLVCHVPAQAKRVLDAAGISRLVTIR